MIRRRQGLRKDCCHAALGLLCVFLLLTFCGLTAAQTSSESSTTASQQTTTAPTTATTSSPATTAVPPTDPPTAPPPDRTPTASAHISASQSLTVPGASDYLGFEPVPAVSSRNPYWARVRSDATGEVLPMFRAGSQVGSSFDASSNMYRIVSSWQEGRLVEHYVLSTVTPRTIATEHRPAESEPKSYKVVSAEVNTAYVVVSAAPQGNATCGGVHFIVSDEMTTTIPAEYLSTNSTSNSSTIHQVQPIVFQHHPGVKLNMSDFVYVHWVVFNKPNTTEEPWVEFKSAGDIAGAEAEGIITLVAPSPAIVLNAPIVPSLETRLEARTTASFISEWNRTVEGSGSKKGGGQAARGKGLVFPLAGYYAGHAIAFLVMESSDESCASALNDATRPALDTSALGDAVFVAEGYRVDATLPVRIVLNMSASSSGSPDLRIAALPTSTSVVMNQFARRGWTGSDSTEGLLRGWPVVDGQLNTFEPVYSPLRHLRWVVGTPANFTDGAAHISWLLGSYNITVPDDDVILQKRLQIVDTTVFVNAPFASVSGSPSPVAVQPSSVSERGGAAVEGYLTSRGVVFRAPLFHDIQFLIFDTVRLDVAVPPAPIPSLATNAILGVADPSGGPSTTSSATGVHFELQLLNSTNEAGEESWLVASNHTLGAFGAANVEMLHKTGGHYNYRMILMGAEAWAAGDSKHLVPFFELPAWRVELVYANYTFTFPPSPSMPASAARATVAIAVSLAVAVGLVVFSTVASLQRRAWWNKYYPAENEDGTELDEVGA